MALRAILLNKSALYATFQTITQLHLAGNPAHQKSAAEDEESPSKRRRRSEDRDVGQAKADTSGPTANVADTDAVNENATAHGAGTSGVGDTANGADTGQAGDTASGVQLVNGHSLTEANGNVPPEAAFWSSLEDAKDEVSGALCVCTALCIALCLQV